VPEDKLGPGDNADSLVDPDGVGPRIWFQVVPEVTLQDPEGNEFCVH
jgi:hypothetical protein